jgi:branched-chain amino acid transport system substrate-binding protein
MMVVTAMEQAQSDDPYDVAVQLEDMRFTNIGGDELWMRPDDHQLIQPLYISKQTDEGIEFDADNSGFGLFTEYEVSGDDTALEHSCRMRRPRR